MTKKQNDLGQKITDQIVAMLENGTAPWIKPWNVSGCNAMPCNLVSQKSYRGINVLILGIEQMECGYSSHYWLTYKQAQTFGAHVRKGQKGVQIVFWKTLTTEQEDKTTGEKEDRSIRMMRTYTVFNLDQIEANEEMINKLTKLKAAATPESKTEIEQSEAAQKIADGYFDQTGAPEVTHGGGRAYYSPSEDRINVPKPEDFRSTGGYWSTMYHEAAHSTGASKRLERNGVSGSAVNFGSDLYSKEELIAEMSAAMLCAIAGVSNDKLIENQAAYCRNWAKKISNDSKLVISAAQAAQKACDYIMGVEF